MEHDLPEPPWRTPRKQPARRSLSREAIVEAAMGVLRKEGIDGVSMRRVATELSTGAASLYAHVANKDELVELLFDEVVAEIPLPEPDPARWREQLTQLWVDSRAALMRYRDIARAALGSVPLGPNALRVTETTMQLLRLGGVPDQAIAWATDVVGLYVSASAVEGAMRAQREEGRLDARGRYIQGEDQARQLQEYFAALPADRFPTFVALLPHLTTGTDDERFRFGLDLLVGGLTGLATGPRAAGP
ncbi:TetR family transcriptional regulator ActII [Pseudonocardia yuanmonensis]|uniref:TetR family transcriptional regulator ActII n=1 Tax=Pseudonocardia yuanmonensis TaxID=1095914 RepID=A0ABP8W0U3_9PSEU